MNEQIKNIAHLYSIAHPLKDAYIADMQKDSGYNSLTASPEFMSMIDSGEVTSKGIAAAINAGKIEKISTTPSAELTAAIESLNTAKQSFLTLVNEVLLPFNCEVASKRTRSSNGTPSSVKASQLKKDIVEAARIYAQSSSSSILYAMGITQHATGTNNVLALANLAMVTGQIGKPSSGVNPLRGQNNVQGACDMGGLPNVYTAYQRVDDDAVREKFEKVWGAPLSPRVGLTLMEMMKGIADGKVKALFILGENPLLSDPNVSKVKEELKHLDLLVVQDIFLTETAELAHVVLPGVSFAEKDGTFTNTERRVQRVRKAIEPIGNSRPDWQIVCDLASRLGYPMHYGFPGEIMDEIASLTPSYAGIRYERLEKLGLQWPCPTQDHPGTPILHKDKFTRGKGKFHVTPYAPPPELPDETYPFLLTTGRVLYHYHTVMTRRSKGLSEIYPEGVVELNADDARRLGIRPDNGRVEVTSRRGRVRAKAKIAENLPPGVVFMTFHFREAAVNLLTIDVLDPVAKIPEFKVCAVRVEKVK